MKKYKKPSEYKKQETQILSVRIRTDLLSRFKSLSKKEDLKLNTLINGILEDYIEWYSKK